MTVQLTVPVPDDVMEQLATLAEEECRTPEGHVLWLIKRATRTAVPARQTKEERLFDARPLFAELRELHLRAGKPSTRVLTAMINEAQGETIISHSTVHTVLNGTLMPSLPMLERIIHALGGDSAHFRELWMQAQSPSAE